MPYRVITQDGYTEFTDHDLAVAFFAKYGIGGIEEFEAPKHLFDKAAFISDLSYSFDAKFSDYWLAKGYTDIDDLLSHAANQNSKYHEEALMLIEWSHEQWELAIQNIDENSNVEQIIKLLPDI